jgi:DNA-binding transcriptional MerR regulator
MISRNDYAGPITKSAEAMFARAERRARRNAPRASFGASRAARPASPVEQALGALGLSLATLRHWEEVGVVQFERRGGRRVFDEAALEAVRTVAQLRRAGFSIKQIAWISDTLPPSVAAMRQELQDRQDLVELERTGARWAAKLALTASPSLG